MAKNRSDITDDMFIDAMIRLGSMEKVSKAFNMNVRSCYERRNAIEARRGVIIPTWQQDNSKRMKVPVQKLGHRRLFEMTGMAVIFSDAHFWPNEKSVAFDALKRFLKKYKKDIKLIVCNGDAFDGARISRHPPTGWAHMPEVADELAACKENLGDIEALADDGVPLIWCMGNHDTRFSARLAQMAPDYVRIHGTDLPDHFPAWEHCWSLEINGHTMVKHRWHNGVHATYNNTLKGGRNIFTGHIHRLCVTPITDYNGRRYGVDTGTLSDFGPTVDKFAYGEDNPYNWASGFAVATFDEKGKLLPPELVTVIDGTAYWRGSVI
jgi:hypothetical protein